MEAVKEKIAAINDKLASHDRRLTKHGEELDRLEERKINARVMDNVCGSFL